MEQTIAFVLGVLAVLALAGVYNMFKTRVQVKDLYEEIEDLQDLINELERDYESRIDLIDRRVDQEIDRSNNLLDKLEIKLYQHYEELISNTELNIDTTHKYVDSRTDKLEERMKDNIAKLIADVYSNMDVKFNDNTSFVDGLYHSIKDLTKKKNK